MKQRIFESKGIGRCLASLAVLVLVFGVSLTQRAFAAMPVFNSDEAVYLVEQSSGEVMAAQNEDAKIYPASTTKLMTALVAMDYVGDKLDDKVTVGDEISLAESDSSSANLVAGETYTWKEILYGMLIPSGNDAALTIAVNVAKIQTGNKNLDNQTAIQDFVKLMNDKASSFGLTSTHFVNPHGLQDGDHYTTAKELYVIAQKAVANQTIAEIVKTPIHSVTLADGTTKKWINTNYLLFDDASAAQATGTTFQDGVSGDPYYTSLATGIKTGHTDEAGQCLVFSSKDNDKVMLGVIMKGADKDTVFSQADDAINSLSSDYGRLTWTDDTGVIQSVHIKEGHIFDGRKLSLKTDGSASSMVLTSEKNNYKTEINLDTNSFDKVDDNTYRILASVTEGQQIGTLDVQRDGKTVRQIPILAGNQMHTRNFVDYLMFFLFIVVVVMVGLFIYAKVVANQRKTERKRRRRKHI